MRTSSLFTLIVALASSSHAWADADPLLGVAVRANETIQIIDPDPHYRGDPTPGSDGLKAVRSMTRYRLDREKMIIIPSNDPQTGRPGTPANGTGELINGTQVLSGDGASGEGSTGRVEVSASPNGGTSSSTTTTGGPVSR